MLDFSQLEVVTQDHSDVSGVYAIVRKDTGRAYIGSTSDLWKRQSNHLSALEDGGHHCDELQSDWCLIGQSGFEFLVVETVDEMAARDREQHIIMALMLIGAPMPYNTKVCLTKAEVVEMRRLRRETRMPFAKIGSRYGVLSRAARRAIQGETWSHVEDVPPVDNEPSGVKHPNCKGEGSAHAKLTRKDVVEIRRILKGGGSTYREMAERFGVSVQTARKAARGESWKHLNGVEAPFVWKG